MSVKSQLVVYALLLLSFRAFVCPWMVVGVVVSLPGGGFRSLVCVCVCVCVCAHLPQDCLPDWDVTSAVPPLHFAQFPRDPKRFRKCFRAHKVSAALGLDVLRHSIVHYSIYTIGNTQPVKSPCRLACAPLLGFPQNANAQQQQSPVGTLWTRSTAPVRTKKGTENGSRSSQAHSTESFDTTTLVWFHSSVHEPEGTFSALRQYVGRSFRKTEKFTRK